MIVEVVVDRVGGIIGGVVGVGVVILLLLIGITVAVLVLKRRKNLRRGGNGSTRERYPNNAVYNAGTVHLSNS
jgi:uncharacterized membrane protein YczE